MIRVLQWCISVLTLILIAALALYFMAGWDLKPLDDEAREQAPGAFAELSDGTIHYRLEGPEDGPLIVMVHGYSTPNFVFEQNVDPLIDAGFRVLRYDHFGRGWSDRPKTQYDADLYDRALLELLDHLQLAAPFGLVGLSMGGLIASEFTARHPERVDRLFLFVPAGLDTRGGNGFAARLITVPGFGDWIWRPSRWPKTASGCLSIDADAARCKSGSKRRDARGRHPCSGIRGDRDRPGPFPGCSPSATAACGFLSSSSVNRMRTSNISSWAG